MDYMDPRAVWQRANKEKHRESCKRYRENYRDRTRASASLYYYSNKEKCLLANRLWEAQNRERVAARAIRNYIRGMSYTHEYLSKHPCEKCGQREISRLVFHHVDKNTKFMGVANLAGMGYPLKTIQLEMDKCIILCNSCHTKHHAAERRAMKNAE